MVQEIVRRGALICFMVATLNAAIVQVLHGQTESANPRKDARPRLGSKFRGELQKSPDTETGKFIDINNIKMWVLNNGKIGHDPITHDRGLEWPKNSGRLFLFDDGPLWGGYTTELQMGGSYQWNGFQPGVINDSGKAADPNNPRYRVYKVQNIARADFLLLDAGGQAALRSDFSEWPAADGAPFVDSNHNGRYDPDFEAWLQDTVSSDKPLFIGDELIWFTANQMGIQVNTLVWAYKTGPVLENAVFIKHTFIYKADPQLKKFVLGFQSDPDVGDWQRNFITFDSTLQLVAAYSKASISTTFGDTSAVIGNLVLEGPIRPMPGETASFNFQQRAGYQSAKISGFNCFLEECGPHPELGDYYDRSRFYMLLQGNRSCGSWMIDPLTNERITRIFPGDPATRTGYIDGHFHSPDDRWYVSGYPQITFVQGDTQEIVRSIIFSGGGSNLLGLMNVRKSARLIKTFFSLLPFQAVIPTTTLSVSYPDETSTRIRLTALAPGSTNVTGILKNADGSEFARFSMYDDGQHNDGAAADFVFGGTYDAARRLEGVDCFIEAMYEGGRKAEWFVEEGVPLAGAVHASFNRIESDQLNFDGTANPGENVRLSVSVSNRTPYELDAAAAVEFIAREESTRYIEMNPDSLHHEKLRISPPIGAGATAIVPYLHSDPGTYFSCSIQRGKKDGENVSFPIMIFDAHHNRWWDTLSIPVHSFSSGPCDSLTTHIAGNCTGTLGWRLVDKSALNNHRYKVTVQTSDSGKCSYLTVTDLDSARVLPTQRIPDAFAHESTIIDGWKLTRGTADSLVSFDKSMDVPIDAFGHVTSEYYPPGHRWLVPRDEWEWQAAWKKWWGSALTTYDLFPVKLVFDSVSTQKAYCYFRSPMKSGGYSGYFDIPIRAYDMSDTTHPRQINVAFTETNGGTRQNGRWDPDEDPFIDVWREYLFVLSSSYTDKPNQKYISKDISTDAATMDILYGAWFCKVSAGASFHNGDFFMIQPNVPISTRDTFYLKPTAPVRIAPGPAGYSLGQNYPNPVAYLNATTIPIDISAAGNVSVKVYDFLGRPVAAVFEGPRDAGAHTFVFTPPKNCVAGQYILEVTINGQRQQRSMIVLK